MREKLTHFDEKGNAVMVDVSEKEVTSRVAVASGKIRVNAKVMEAVKKGTSKKGDVLGVARVAGIMAGKQTANLIPMCHTLLISKCEIAYEISEAAVEIIISSWNIRKPIRMLTITGINLCDEDTEEQISLFGTDTVSREKTENLERVMDSIRARYGQSSITFGKFKTDELGIDPYSDDD